MFHSLPHNEALGAGSAGPGKSLVLLMDPIAQVVVESQRQIDPEHPYPVRAGQSLGWAVHLRRESTMLDQTITRAKRLFPVIDPGFKWYESDKRGVFASGYKYDFRHCKDPDDWLSFQSNEYCHIGYDELVQFTQEQYEQINTRLRSSDPVLRLMLKIRAMSNPEMRRPSTSTWNVENPNWVRDYFVQPAPKGRITLSRELTMESGEKVERTRIYLPATLWDNPDKEFVRRYEQELQAQKPHVRQALLYGNWYVTAGSFYGDEWRESLHVVKPYKVPPYWRTFRSMDWGYKKPGCVGWFALNDDDDMVMFRELTFQGKTDEQVCDLVKRIETTLGLWNNTRGSLITGPADTQLWEKRGESVMSKAEVFLANGIPWVPAEKAARGAGAKMGGRQRNAELLSQRLKDHAKGTAHPGIVFFNTCVKTIETLPAIQTDPGNSELPLDGGEDHWHDVVLYACAYASRPDMVRRPDAGEDEGDDDRNKGGAGNGRGRHGYGAH